MTSDFYNSIQQAISQERLNAYRKNTASDVSTLARYIRNIALCESLYPALQTIEIALRNSLHAGITVKYGTSQWYDVQRGLLGVREQHRVDQAKLELSRSQKPHDSDRLVAELSFGFWTSLLDARYERQQILWPSLLKVVFPNMPNRIRTRRNLSSRFTIIRRLRNRVFHHERILHWMNLEIQHAEILEAIGWINQDLLQLITPIDKFPDTYRRESIFWENTIIHGSLHV